MTTPDDLDEALALVAPRFAQPKLRPLEPNERYVRTAGLKFILPMNFKSGDVLDDKTAAILNQAYTTLVINRFAPIRAALLENDNTIYEDIDRELRAHFASFTYTPRPVIAGEEDEKLSEEDRDLVTFARPHFQKAFGGQGIARKDYEMLLREYVVGNRLMLEKLKKQSDDLRKSLTEDLGDVFGED